MDMEEYKIKGYVARDMDVHITTDLFLYFGHKPQWQKFAMRWGEIWEDTRRLPKEWFPNLKYTDQPIEVEIIIRPKHEETTKTPKG